MSIVESYVLLVLFLHSFYISKKMVEIIVIFWQIVGVSEKEVERKFFPWIFYFNSKRDVDKL